MAVIKLNFYSLWSILVVFLLLSIDECQGKQEITIATSSGRCGIYCVLAYNNYYNGNRYTVAEN